MAGTCGECAPKSTGGRRRRRRRWPYSLFINRPNKSCSPPPNMASTNGFHGHRHDMESDSAVEEFLCYAASERAANAVGNRGPRRSWWRRAPSRPRRVKLLLFLLFLLFLLPLVGIAIVGVTGLLCTRFGIIPGLALECEAQSAADDRLGGEAGRANLSASSVAFLPGEWVGGRW